MSPDPLPPPEAFLAAVAAAAREGRLVKLTLGKPRGVDPTLRQLLVRPVRLRGADQLTFVWRHERRDVTKNLPLAEGLRRLAPLVGAEFHSGHLFTPEFVLQLEYNRRGAPRLTRGPGTGAPPDTAHDRAKRRLLPAASQDWLQRLGVTTPSGAVREGLADKHRQIHRFVEILHHLVSAGAGAADALPTHRPVEVADMGCGKGYLTFAAHDYFRHVAGRPARVRGIEARPDLVAQCQQAAAETGRDQLTFAEGTIASASLPALDVLVALHACDTATDDALARGVQAGAALLLVAPCCQHELRAGLQAPPGLGAALRHGIFQERHAEFVTDALRALLLEWAGYDTKVFEFISTEHTAKNLMITARRRSGPARTEAAAQDVRALASAYGIRTHTLARHLTFPLA
ncbi:MAG: SAM-dependent methyltransferase [Opitutaceae bacterium]|nr:SAM-dependent methyltransferase [Opitutaceae bacterium]